MTATTSKQVHSATTSRARANAPRPSSAAAPGAGPSSAELPAVAKAPSSAQHWVRVQAPPEQPTPGRRRLSCPPSPPSASNSPNPSPSRCSNCSHESPMAKRSRPTPGGLSYLVMLFVRPQYRWLRLEVGRHQYPAGKAQPFLFTLRRFWISKREEPATSLSPGTMAPPPIKEQAVFHSFVLVSSSTLDAVFRFSDSSLLQLHEEPDEYRPDPDSYWKLRRLCVSQKRPSSWNRKSKQ